MHDVEETRALEEARWLVDEFGIEAPLYAAMKAKTAIEQRDYTRCARWKRVLEILEDGKVGDVTA